MFYVYVMKCRDRSLYTGYTNDVEKRVAAHNSGTASKYTRSRRPVKLVHQWQYKTKSDAMRAEAAFKRLSRSEKLRHLSSSGKL
ncbi:MAG TPA: GIY-YIG nuclease family protein [archaeon]|nr:GIY-YIG nuclease family protein [archaeon]